MPLLFTLNRSLLTGIIRLLYFGFNHVTKIIVQILNIKRLAVNKLALVRKLLLWSVIKWKLFEEVCIKKTGKLYNFNLIFLVNVRIMGYQKVDLNHGKRHTRQANWNCQEDLCLQGSLVRTPCCFKRLFFLVNFVKTFKRY